MIIGTDKVVTFHYRLNEPDQEVIEDSRDAEPMVYLHGHQGMLKGLEEALEGKKASDQFTITLSPDQAYGPLREDAVQRVSMKHIVNPSKKKIKYKPGMTVQVNTAHGPRDVLVKKVGLKNMDVDTNHPLAGKTLVFEVEVLDVREASAEEISHGHVHGEGGHQH